MTTLHAQRRAISLFSLQKDPVLEKYRIDLIVSTARKLDKARMVRFDERTHYLSATDLGRTASHFYIKYPSIEVSSIMQGIVCDRLSLNNLLYKIADG